MRSLNSKESLHPRSSTTPELNIVYLHSFASQTEHLAISWVPWLQCLAVQQQHSISSSNVLRLRIRLGLASSVPCAFRHAALPALARSMRPHPPLQRSTSNALRHRSVNLAKKQLVNALYTWVKDLVNACMVGSLGYVKKRGYVT